MTSITAPLLTNETMSNSNFHLPVDMPGNHNSSRSGGAALFNASRRLRIDLRLGDTRHALCGLRQLRTAAAHRGLVEIIGAANDLENVLRVSGSEAPQATDLCESLCTLLESRLKRSQAPITPESNWVTLAGPLVP
jgi:fructose-specific component phosphotransferase system IIB-like protein